MDWPKPWEGRPPCTAPDTSEREKVGIFMIKMNNVTLRNIGLNLTQLPLRTCCGIQLHANVNLDIQSIYFISIYECIAFKTQHIFHSKIV